MPETCAQCHAARRIITQYQLPPDVFSTYVQSFHGLALKGGNSTVANCASCHGVHDILPSSDPLSSVNPADLPKTCGRCHPGIGTRLAAEFFKVHAPAGPREDKPWIVNLISLVYMVMIVLTIGGMALFVTLDYGRKARDHVRAVKADPHAEVRLTPWLRQQHTVLTVLFVGLVYTGFVHRFPEAFFSWPFTVMPEGNAVRALLHRVFGWAFVVFFAAHLGVLVVARTGRGYARALWFGWDDASDVAGQLLYNLGLRPEPPPRRRWNYAEKAEYLGARLGVRGDGHHGHHARVHGGHAAPVAEGVARRRAGRPLPGGRAGDAGHPRLARLLGGVRPRRVPHESGVDHRHQGLAPRARAGSFSGSRGAWDAALGGGVVRGRA